MIRRRAEVPSSGLTGGSTKGSEWTASSMGEEYLIPAREPEERAFGKRERESGGLMNNDSRTLFWLPSWN